VIEILSSREGGQVIKYKGKHLSSPTSPLSAAKKWLIDAEALVFNNLQDYDVAFVVGAGSGYEIAELCRKYPKLEVVVIDTNPVLIDRIKKIHPQLVDRVAVFCASSCQELYNSGFISELLKKLYVVFSCRNSMRDEKFTLNQFVQTLNCRGLESFQKFSVAEGLLKKKNDITEIKNKLSKNEVLSIKHLAELKSSRYQDGDYVSELILTLRELVI
jgi:hypothetical protein